MSEKPPEKKSPELFFARYMDIHGKIIPMMLDSLSEDQLRASAVEQLNPIVWMLWHIYRAEDVGLNRLVTDGVEVFDQGSWAGRLDVQIRYAGTGMTAKEVSALSSRIRIDDLKSYGQAVHKRTVEIVNALTGSELSEVPDNAHINRVMCQEEVLPECAWSYLSLYYGKTKGWFLMHLGLTHSYYHIGQISLAKKLLV